MAMVACPSLRNLQFKVHSSSPFFPYKRRIFPNGHLRINKKSQHCMFLKKPIVKDGVLSFNGRDALIGVPDNVIITPWSESSAFLGATASESSFRHVFKLGVIEEARLLCLFRFKIWWMIPRVGNSAMDIPIETQMLLLEAREEQHSEKDEGNTAYVLFLPILNDVFRSSLQGNSADELEVCVETGDPSVVASECVKAVFVNHGNNPFQLLKESMMMLQNYCGTFELRNTKQMPGMLDYFGWCTWDAFYHDVNPQGIRDGLKSLSEGGTPARFLIIDDGWQDTTNEFQKEGEPFVEGTQFGARLVSIKENKKFQETEKVLSSQSNGLKEFVSEVKKNFGLKYVYVWHALMGYWGGLHPDAHGTKKYNPTLKFPIQSPGNRAHQRDISMDSMEEYGVGTIDPNNIFEFYDDLHGYLASQEVDGVKVDVQNILETVATGSSGRVSLTRHFQQALEKSIAKNFQDNGIICCMAQNTDSVYNMKRSAITRASDDYYPKNPTTQTLHIAAIAYNSIFFGEVLVPDWDMFYSCHPEAEFHAVARAVGGCGVYVSDIPGQHDFEILRRLVLPDGSVLRAKYPGKPSRDCLFSDPVMDGISLLKIWNLNKITGVLAVFNCQGAGTWPGMESTVQLDRIELVGKISPADIEYLDEVSPKSCTGDFAMFSFRSGSISRLPMHGKLGITLKTLQCDIFTVSPIKFYHQKVHFAPIGLVNMYNSGGAVEAIEVSDDSSCYGVQIKGRGAGIFGAYSDIKPNFCSVNNIREAEFDYRSEKHFLTVSIPTGTNAWDVTVHY
ncbi:probable galactinol--sucrose galactosyltransferase 2 [Olea europaea subsp. europaea]|uniref:galactinol--sucrose galactosyltransferase n=3 Tax=Olea europaea subsp. europaea TaxID=158383 RepID=A0A8S0VEC0_OLEEU|nr:probable galactinol--sucrose galactosyltransferase 2 [Olea europaea subsp. europaea]